MYLKDVWNGTIVSGTTLEKLGFVDIDDEKIADSVYNEYDALVLPQVLATEEIEEATPRNVYLFSRRGEDRYKYMHKYKERTLFTHPR